MSTETSGLCGVILAGGKASRMAYADKPLLKLGDREILQHVIERARPQVDELAISVNRNSQAFHKFGLPCLGDRRDAFAGPLVGIATAMEWHLKQAQEPLALTALACFPADVPIFPLDLVARLRKLMTDTGTDVVLTRSDQQIQPLFSLWSFTLLDRLWQALDRKLFGPKLLLPEIEHEIVQIHTADCEAGCFFNINSPADLHSMKFRGQLSGTT